MQVGVSGSRSKCLCEGCGWWVRICKIVVGDAVASSLGRGRRDFKGQAMIPVCWQRCCAVLCWGSICAGACT